MCFLLVRQLAILPHMEVNNSRTQLSLQLWHILYNIISYQVIYDIIPHATVSCFPYYIIHTISIMITPKLYHNLAHILPHPLILSLTSYQPNNNQTTPQRTILSFELKSKEKKRQTANTFLSRFLCDFRHYSFY